MGDGALVEFASVVDAVACALEIQKLVRERNCVVPEDRSIHFRIGINVGDVIVDGDDIYGDGVNVAARIEALADPGSVYLARMAADEVRDKLPITLGAQGRTAGEERRAPDRSVPRLRQRRQDRCLVGSATPPCAARRRSRPGLPKRSATARPIAD